MTRISASAQTDAIATQTAFTQTPQAATSCVGTQTWSPPSMQSRSRVLNRAASEPPSLSQEDRGITPTGRRPSALGAHNPLDPLAPPRTQKPGALKRKSGEDVSDNPVPPKRARTGTVTLSAEQRKARLSKVLQHDQKISFINFSKLRGKIQGIDWKKKGTKTGRDVLVSLATGASTVGLNNMMATAFRMDDAARSLALGQSLSSLVTHYTNNACVRLIDALIKVEAKATLPAMYVLIDRLKTLEAQDDEAIPETRAVCLDAFDSYFQRSDSQPNGPDPLDDKQKTELLTLRETVIKEFPARLINTSHEDKNGDVLTRDRINKDVKRLWGSYPTGVRPKLRAFIARSRANSVSQKPRRAQTYLYGATGVGKTYLITQIAKRTGQRLVPIEITPSDSWASLIYNPNPKTGESKVGKLVKAYMECGVLNPILYFDEVDGAFQSYGIINLLKKVTDPETTKLVLVEATDSAPEVAVRFEHPSVVLGGNTKLTDQALRRRLGEITVPPIDKDTKRAIVAEQFEAILQDQGWMSDDLATAVVAEARNYLEPVLEADARHGCPNSTTAVDTLDDVVSFVGDAIRAGDPILRDEVQNIIEEGFKSRL
jgi:MoxR-like ATPase